MQGYNFAKGVERNPLKRYRNLPCPCGSGKKVKRCHGTDGLSHSDAAKARAYLRELSTAGFITVRASHFKK